VLVGSSVQPKYKLGAPPTIHERSSVNKSCCLGARRVRRVVPAVHLLHPDTTERCGARRVEASVNAGWGRAPGFRAVPPRSCSLGWPGLRGKQPDGGGAGRRPPGTAAGGWCKPGGVAGPGP
jgi:hypothetical protein